MEGMGSKRKQEESEMNASSLQFPFSKPAPRTKAVARPEEPDGVEDVCYDDIVVTVPTQLFKLDGLHQVLNLTTWEKCLTPGERNFLIQFLPDVDDVTELLTKLLEGQSNFFFGNPMERIWELMKQGECHPRVTKYREALRCLNHCQHFHAVREYHNHLVMTLRQMAQDNGLPLDQRLQKWNAMIRDKALYTDRRDSKKQRKRN